MISVDNRAGFTSIPVDGIALFFFDNYFGGLAFRLRYGRAHEAIVLVQSEIAFELSEQFSLAIDHFRKHGATIRDESYLTHLYAGLLTQHEVEAVAQTNSVGSFDFNVYANGVVWDVKTAVGTKLSFSFDIDMVTVTSILLFAGLKRGYLIDLRPYANASWRQMSDVLETLPGIELRQQVSGFEFSLEVLRRHCRAMLAHFSQGDINNSRTPLRFSSSFETQRFLHDCTFHIFNFVSAAKALVEHSYSFYKQAYKPSGMIPRYADEIKKRFDRNGLVGFVHELRNLVHHRGHVGLVHEISARSGVVKSVVLMSREELLNWNRWTEPPRKWIAEQARGIEVEAVFNVYMKQIEAFHEWFESERELAHWREYREAELLRRAILTKRGMGEIPKLSALVMNASSPHKSIQQIIAELIGSTHEAELRSEESDVHRWVLLAMPYLEERYFIDLEVRAALRRRFADVPASERAGGPGNPD